MMDDPAIYGMGTPTAEGSIELPVPDTSDLDGITIDGLIELADTFNILYNMVPEDDMGAFALSSIVWELALRMIAAGHNDPGSVATAALRVLKRPGETMRDVLIERA